MKRSSAFDRRRFLAGSAALGGLALAAPRRVWGQASPAIVTADSMRPQAPYGVMSGDVSADSAIVWSRADRPSRMIVEYRIQRQLHRRPADRRPACASRRPTSPPASMLRDLPPGQRRLLPRQLPGPRRPQDRQRARRPAGSARRPASARDVTLRLVRRHGRPGLGHQPGLRRHEDLRGHAPARARISSSTPATRSTPTARSQAEDDARRTARVWKNIVTPEKSKVAETLDEFRGNYRYNLLDENVRRFNAEVPQIGQWDDHEVTNNWYWRQGPAQPTSATRKSASPLLVARATRAFLEYAPMRRLGRARPSASTASIPYGPLARRLRHRHAQLSRAQQRQPPGDSRPRDARSSAASRSAG